MNYCDGNDDALTHTVHDSHMIVASDVAARNAQGLTVERDASPVHV